jgi:hypothetical protein
MKISLEHEMWSAVDNIRQGHLDLIEALAVPRKPLATLGAIQPPLGVDRVQWLSGGFYEPDADGEAAAILPVCVLNGFSLLDVVDLIAWKTSRPSAWRWRIGQGWALGEHLLDDGLQVLVISTQLDWLKVGGKALCILDWSAPPPCWAHLRSSPSLQFTDEATRQLVRNTLVATAPMPIMELAHAA